MLLISTFVIDMDMLAYLDAVILNGEDYIILQISELVGGEVMIRLMEKQNNVWGMVKWSTDINGFENTLGKFKCMEDDEQTWTGV